MITVNKKQASVLALVAIFAAVMMVGPVATNSAFAHNIHHGKDWWKRHFDRDNNGGNRADQSIRQEQSNEQDSFVVSGDDTDDSGNNLSFQGQLNTGDNALGQDSSSD
jgi:hypothetical protein